MYLGIRDIRAAKGRFALIGSVVGLITLLLVMLTGLTGGLGAQNTSALSALKADRFVFGAGTSQTDDGKTPQAEVSFTASGITREQAEAWRGTDGVEQATPIGITQTRVEGDSAATAAIFGVPDGSDLPHRAAGEALQGTAQIRSGTAVVSRTAASDLGVGVGDRVAVGGQKLEVAGVLPDEWYSHSPVIWTDTGAWQGLTHASGAGEQTPVGTVLAVRGNLDDAAWTAAEHRTDTVTATTRGSFQGLASYSSERGSLLTMQGFLYGISALVTISFLTVWTIQRTRDIAVLRALGAAGSYLVRDAVGQAAVILAVGVAAGTLAATGLGALAARGVPFTLDAATTLVPAAGIWILGILGSLVAVRRVATVDPMIALGGN